MKRLGLTPAAFAPGGLAPVVLPVALRDFRPVQLATVRPSFLPTFGLHAPPGPPAHAPPGPPAPPRPEAPRNPRERVLLAAERQQAGREQDADEPPRHGHGDRDGERVQRRATPAERRLLDVDRLLDGVQDVLRAGGVRDADVRDVQDWRELAARRGRRVVGHHVLAALLQLGGAPV